MGSEQETKKPLEHILIEEGLSAEETRELNDSLDVLDSDLGEKIERSVVKRELIEQEIAKYSYLDHTTIVLRLSGTKPGSGLEVYKSSLKKYDNVTTLVVGRLDDIKNPDKRDLVRHILAKYLKEDNRLKLKPKLIHREHYSKVGDALEEEGIVSIFGDTSMFDDSEPTMDIEQFTADEGSDTTVEVVSLDELANIRKALIIDQDILQGILETTVLPNCAVSYPEKKIDDVLASKEVFKDLLANIASRRHYDLIVVGTGDVDAKRAADLTKMLAKYKTPTGSVYFVCSKSKGDFTKEDSFMQVESAKDLMAKLVEYTKSEVEILAKKGEKPLPAEILSIPVGKAVVNAVYENGEGAKQSRRISEGKSRQLPPPPVKVDTKFMKPPAATAEADLEQIANEDKDKELEKILEMQYKKAGVELSDEHRLVAKALLEKYDRKNMFKTTNVVPILLMQYGKTIRDKGKYSRWQENLFRMLAVLANPDVDVPEDKEKNVHTITQIAEMVFKRDEVWKDIEPLARIGLSNYKLGGYDFLNGSLEVIGSLDDSESRPFISKMLARSAEVDIEHAKFYVETVISEYSSKFMEPRNRGMYLFELCQACEKQDQDGNTSWNRLLEVAEEVFNRQHFEEARRKEIDDHYQKEKEALKASAKSDARSLADAIVLKQKKAPAEDDTGEEQRLPKRPPRPAPSSADYSAENRQKATTEETLDMMLDDDVEPEHAAGGVMPIEISENWSDQFGLADVLAPPQVSPPEPTDATKGLLVQEQIRTLPPRNPSYTKGEKQEPERYSDSILEMVQQGPSDAEAAAKQTPPPVPNPAEAVPALQTSQSEADQIEDQIADLVFNGDKQAERPAVQEPEQVEVDPNAEYTESNMRVRSAMFPEYEKPVSAAEPDLEADIESAEGFTGDVEAMLEAPEPAIPDEGPGQPVADYTPRNDEVEMPVDGRTDEAEIVADAADAVEIDKDFVRPVPEGLDKTVYMKERNGQDPLKARIRVPIRGGTVKDEKAAIPEFLQEEVGERGEETEIQHDDIPSSEEVIRMPEEKPARDAPSPEKEGMSPSAKWVLGIGVPATIALAAYIGAAMQANNDEKAVEDFNRKVITQTLNSDECKKMKCAALYGNKHLKAAIDDRFLPDDNVGDRSVDKEGLVKRMGLIRGYVAVFGMPKNESAADYMVNAPEGDLEGKIAVGKEALSYRAQRSKQSFARKRGLKQVQKRSKRSRSYAKIWVHEPGKKKPRVYQTRNTGILDTRAKKQYKRSL